MALKRIAQEHTSLQIDPLETSSADPASDENLLNWVGIVAGPPDTPYSEGLFKISIQFPENYPHAAPWINFSTPIFHPNVGAQGELRLAELEQTQWSPAFTIRSILISLQAMLSEPNLLESCVLNAEAAKLYSEDLEVFKERAFPWAALYAIE